MTGLSNAKVTTTVAVTNLERATKFYERTLGLKNVGNAMGDDADAIFQGGDGTILYVYARSEPSGSTATVCSFDVGNNVENAVKDLRGKGVEFEEYDLPDMGLKTVNGVATMGDVKAAWFKDPDGNILAIGNGRIREIARTSSGQTTPQARA